MAPETPVRSQTDVQIRLKNGDVLDGRYGRLTTVSPPDYTSRFVEAVRRNSALRSIPVPGDTIRALSKSQATPSIEGAFLGVSGMANARLGLRLQDGTERFYAFSELDAIMQPDGNPVRLESMQASVVRGELPNLSHISLVTVDGIVVESISDIEAIVVRRERSRGGASLVGLLIDGLIVVAIATVGGKVGGTWN